MGGGGGKGGSTSTEVAIPAWLEDAAKASLARGEHVAGIGYVPYRGPDVAALTPLQEAAMANTSAASSAFGLGASPKPGAGMPAVQTFAGGVRGYSSAPLYDQALNELKMRDPAQYAKLTTPYVPTPAPAPVAAPSYDSGQGNRSYYEAPQGSGASRNTQYDTYSTAADTKAREDKAKAAGAPSRPSSSGSKK